MDISETLIPTICQTAGINQHLNQFRICCSFHFLHKTTITAPSHNLHTPAFSFWPQGIRDIQVTQQLKPSSNRLYITFNECALRFNLNSLTTKGYLRDYYIFFNASCQAKDTTSIVYICIYMSHNVARYDTRGEIMHMHRTK